MTELSCCLCLCASVSIEDGKLALVRWRSIPKDTCMMDGAIGALGRRLMSKVCLWAAGPGTDFGGYFPKPIDEVLKIASTLFSFPSHLSTFPPWLGCCGLLSELSKAHHPFVKPMAMGRAGLGRKGWRASDPSP